MGLNKDAQGRIRRALEVLGEQRPRDLAGDDLLHAVSVENGKLRYWLADLAALVHEVDGANPVDAAAKVRNLDGAK